MNELSIEKVWPGWEILGSIGSGDFSDVYAAKSALDGSEVYAAVKVISVSPSEEALESARGSGIKDDLLKTYFGKFKNDLSWELTMYRSLACPNLAPVDAFAAVDKETAGWQGYVRMPLYTPCDVYFEKKRPTEGDTVRLGREICAAIEKLEGTGVQHGDIKQSNILVADNGTFVLCDFGVRRCLEKAGAGIFPRENTAYDAPELAEKGKYTARSDVYSLGMVMRYTANGCTLSEPPAELSEGLEEIIARATAEEPSERYASARELREALEALKPQEEAPRHTVAAAWHLARLGCETERPKVFSTDVSELKGKLLKNRVVEGIIAALLVAGIISAIMFMIPKENPENGAGNDIEMSDGQGAEGETQNE